MAARSSGDVTGPVTPLVMLHGGPGSCHANLTPAVLHRGDRPVIMYDQLDCGLSDAPGSSKNWNIARFVDELAAVLDHYGAEKYHVLGHSWGGTVLLEYARRSDPRVEGMIFQSSLISTPRWIKDTDLLRTRLPESTQETLTSCGADFSDPACGKALESFNSRFLARTPYSPALTRYRDTIPNLFNTKLYEHMWGPTEFVATGLLETYDGTTLLPGLRDRPTLFCTGEFDEARPETYRSFARTAGGDFREVPGSGHAVFVDRPRETMTAIMSWLESIE